MIDLPGADVAFLFRLGVDVREVGLPSWKGPGDLLHLLSVVSPVAEDLAVVYRPLMPIPLLELLEERGYRLLDVPEEEFPLMGPNVLALAPRQVLILRGLPRTRAALKGAGCTVHEYEGDEISHKGICFRNAGNVFAPAEPASSAVVTPWRCSSGRPASPGTGRAPTSICYTPRLR